LPAGFVLGDTFRLVAVAGADDHPTPAEVERGKVVSEMTPLSRLQMLLRHQFDRPDQALGRDLGAFLKPNCFLDADLTQKARNRDVNEMVVLMHYAAGQVIVRQGQVIDAAAAAAVAALNEKLAPARQAQQASEQLKSQQEQLRRQQAALQQEQEKARQAEADATKIRDNTLALQAQILAAHTRNLWLLGALAAVLALVVSVVLLSLRRRPSPLNVYPVAAALPAAQPAQLPLQSATSLELAPHLANAVKEAVVQELAAQRGELIKAQQHAAADLADLIHRLDHLHAPLQERLKTYEGRIVELEKQLASRTEENQELLRAKLELLRRQLETEKRGSVRSDWSTAIN
ncbi:MAG TPA: hypothetical protein VFV81_00195, partial [Verrucomicrobiae bacterium]|nr:hypothetical protein [Verrucomicrobiae bacterium]